LLLVENDVASVDKEYEEFVQKKNNPNDSRGNYERNAPTGFRVMIKLLCFTQSAI
jgi:hypothetical protein